MYFCRYGSRTHVFQSVFFADTCISVTIFCGHLYFGCGDFEHPVCLSVFSRTREFLSALFLDTYIYIYIYICVSDSVHSVCLSVLFLNTSTSVSISEHPVCLPYFSRTPFPVGRILGHLYLSEIIELHLY